MSSTLLSTFRLDSFSAFQQRIIFYQMLFCLSSTFFDFQNLFSCFFVAVSSAKISISLPVSLVNVFLLKHSPLTYSICCFRSANQQRQLFIILACREMSTPFFNFFRFFIIPDFIRKKRSFLRPFSKKKPFSFLIMRP